MPRLLLIGWDAADWKIIDPLLAAGEMPHLAKLISSGVRGNIATLYPALSPTLWTSIATGKRPFRHGIHGFTEPTGDGLGVRPVTNLGRTTKAVWNILNQNGNRSIVVGWWPSHPAEPIEGAMVSNHFPPQKELPPEQPIPAEAVWPPAWEQRLAELRVHPIEITSDILRLFVSDLEKIDQSKDKSLHDLAGIIAETMSIHNAATELIERETWDFAAVYYVGIDHFSHRFMRHHAGKARAAEGSDPAWFGQVVKNAYRYHDVMLGRLLALAGPDTSVLLLSDHGFHSDRLLPDYIPAEAAGPALEHRHFGIFCLRAPGVLAGGQVYGASVLDITPTVLHLFGLPAGEDMDGKVLGSAFPDAHVLPRIPSWDEVEGRDGRHPPGRAYNRDASVESLNQLVALGYVAAPEDDAAAAVRHCMAENRYNLARAYLDGGRFSSAAEILEELCASDPEDHRYYQELFHCRMGQGDRRAATAVADRFDRACAEFTVRAQGELKRRFPAGPPEGADLNRNNIFELRQLREKATGFFVPRLMMRCQLALTDLKTDAKKQAAAGVLEQLASACGRGPGPALFLAEGFTAVGDLDRALRYIHRIRRADRDDWRAMALEARIHQLAGRHEHAVSCAADSLLRVYFQPRLHFLLAFSLYKLNELARAEEELRIAIAQMPEFAAAHELLGRIVRKDRARLGEASLHLARAQAFRKRRIGKQEAHKAAAAAAAVGAAPALERWEGTAPADRAQTIVIVSGLPRSGTSMMMQMLAAGGIPPYTDRRREADEDNPRGYFEHSSATNLHRDSSWLTEVRGKAVKIVAHLLPYLPPGEQYRIIFLHRNLEQVVASQRAMLERLKRPGANLSDEDLRRTFTRQLVEVQSWLHRTPDVQMLTVGYDAALANPEETATRLARFLGDPFDPKAAAAAIDPKLRRQ
jgi:predicted AlkP superfamily phosphohydrolase/phosphomutase/tetratricopeptide (TPR) repeat protein